MQPDELLDEFDIDPAPIWPADEVRLEPIFLDALPWLETDDFVDLDIELALEEATEPPSPPRRRPPTFGFAGSLSVHLLSLLVLLGLGEAPAEIADALPVQLVLEAPPSGATPEELRPPQPQAPEAERPHEVPAVNEKQVAAITPPPPPPKPTAIAPHPAKAAPPPEPTPRQNAVQSPPAETSSEAAMSAAAAVSPMMANSDNQPDARSDYFARLVALTRGHLDLLPPSFLAGRHGQTILSVVVADDGTIGKIAIKHSSGYADIDSRIEQVVAAVGRFPPLPGWLRRPIVELDFNLIFPDALQHY